VCNEHQCNGDEMCIAAMDVIIAVDGSGSLKDKGFKILTNFTGELLKRWKPEAYKVEKMRVSVYKERKLI
jgi:hypothetical protein